MDPFYPESNSFNSQSSSLFAAYSTLAVSLRSSVRLKRRQNVDGRPLPKGTCQERGHTFLMPVDTPPPPGRKLAATKSSPMWPSLRLIALILPIVCSCSDAQQIVPSHTRHQLAPSPSRAQYATTVSTSHDSKIEADLGATAAAARAASTSPIVIEITESTKSRTVRENKQDTVHLESNLDRLDGYSLGVHMPLTEWLAPSSELLPPPTRAKRIVIQRQKHRPYVSEDTISKLDGVEALDPLRVDVRLEDAAEQIRETASRSQLNAGNDDDNQSANQSNTNLASAEPQAVSLLSSVAEPLWLLPTRVTTDSMHPIGLANAKQLERQGTIDALELDKVTPRGTTSENYRTIQTDQSALSGQFGTMSDYNYTSKESDVLAIRRCESARCTGARELDVGEEHESRRTWTATNSSTSGELPPPPLEPLADHTLSVANKSFSQVEGNDTSDQMLSVSSDKSPANKRAREHGSIKSHDFSEYDNLFLLNDYRPKHLSSSLKRNKRSLRSSDEQHTGRVEKIYFGGFFPWLADEKTETDYGHTDDKQDRILNNDKLPPSPASMQHLTTETRHQLGKFILPAVRLALDHINTNKTILSAYKLEVVPRDTQCNATISLKQFFDMVYEEPKKMLLYGDACRVSTDPIAKASYFFDLIQISYADTDPIYTIENYPNFFRVVPSENALSLARIPFIRHFNWTRVGTIYQNLPRYSLPHSKLLTDLERFQIVIKQSVSLPGSVDGLQNRDLGDELRKLKEKDVRIILGNFDEEWALLLFCEAYREKMTGRKYQWILTGFSETKLWQFYETKGSSCTKQELLIAMDGYIITDITPVTRSQHRTISGMMAHEYLDEYRRRAREMNISIAENKFYGYVYDGIWAIALALNRVDSLLKYYNQLAREGKVKLKPELASIGSLLDFEYHKPIWVKLIRDALNKTRFDGVTGTVSFHKNERPGLITFSQFQAFRDMNEVIIGSYDALSDQLDLNVGFPIIWRGSSPPIDYTIQRVTPFRINRTLFVIISILALLGIILACIFLFVNIKFRNQRYIKMSSPYLNNLIIIGCILTFTSVIILGLDSGLTSEYNFPYICNARAWVLMAGFTLAFGSMFSKTFRVHSIFTNIKLHKKVIKDYKLFMVVFILLTFDVCILIVWQYFDPFYRETNNGTSIQDPDNEDIIIVPEMEHCQSKRMTIFLSVIYIYKGLLMAFGCFLAWETRHVSIPALNDSKYIGLSVYNVVIMCVIGASLSFILRDQQDASFVIISIFIIFCSTTTLCLVFVPKLIELKQNPRAGDHRVRATLKTFKKNYHDEALGVAAGCRDIHGNPIGRGYGMNLNDRIKLLVDENVKHRSLLKEKTYELEALTSKYRKIQSMVQSGQFLQAISTSAVNGSQLTAGGVGGVGGSVAAIAPAMAAAAGQSNLRAMRMGHHHHAGAGGSGQILLGAPSAGMTSASMSTLHQHTPTGSSSTQTTSVLLTGRSAVSSSRDRVSFSTTNRDLAAANGASAAAESLQMSSTIAAAASDRTANGTLGRQQVPDDDASSPSYLDHNHHHHSQQQQQHQLNEQLGAGQLRSSPLMSSATQLTTTNTTSSTNNTTDLTIDYSSSRLISTATMSSSGMAASTFDTIGADELGNCVHEITRQVAKRRDIPAPKAIFVPMVDRDDGDSNKQQQQRQQVFSSSDKQHTTAVTIDEKAIGRQLAPTGQQGLNLFSMLSHKDSTTANNNSAAARLPAAGQKIANWTGEKREELCNWLGGPFCTLMLRQASLNDWKQQRQLASPARSSNLAGTAASSSKSLANNAPDGASPATKRSASFKKQTSLLLGPTDGPVKAPAKTTLANSARQRMPRTLSMIEYLGLNELDLIARRHDKIVRYNKRRNNNADQMQRQREQRDRHRLLGCCASCECCLSASSSNPLHTGHKNYIRPVAGNCQLVCASSSSKIQPLNLYRMSEGNIAAFSSTSGGGAGGDPYNSDELLQTASWMSCSTCCSLASQTYASNSNLYYDEHESIMTTGTHSSGDSSHSLHHHNDYHSSSSSSSSSRTISSSISHSSSIVIGAPLGGGGGGGPSDIGGGTSGQEQKQHTRSLFGSQSESASSLSVSRSSLVLNQSGGVGPPCIHHQHAARHHHHHHDLFHHHHHQHHHQLSGHSNQPLERHQPPPREEPIHAHTQHSVAPASAIAGKSSDQASFEVASPHLVSASGSGIISTTQRRSVSTSDRLYGQPALGGASTSADAGPMQATSSNAMDPASPFNDDNGKFADLVASAGDGDEQAANVTIRCDILEDL